MPGSCGYKFFEKSMKSKILSRRTLLIVVLIGFALSPAILFYFIPKSPIQSGLALLVEDVATLLKQEQARSGLPVRLKIPGINVDATVEYVGLIPGGVMGVTKERANVSWLNIGPRPGEIGSAVIAGHYGWKDGKAAVFDNLYKLRKGDKLYVEDEKGAVISFVVRESRKYDPKADASDVFFSNDGKPHLNLITCEGVWDKVSKSYSKRLVVFTDKVDSTSSPQE